MNEKNNHKEKFKRNGSWRFVKIKYKENNEEEINYKFAIALQLHNKFYITSEEMILSEKGHRVTIKEIYNTIPASADKSIVEMYKERQRMKLQKQIERRIIKLQKLNSEN